MLLFDSHSNGQNSLASPTSLQSQSSAPQSFSFQVRIEDLNLFQWIFSITSFDQLTVDADSPSSITSEHFLRFPIIRNKYPLISHLIDVWRWNQEFVVVNRSILSTPEGVSHGPSELYFLLNMSFQSFNDKCFLTFDPVNHIHTNYSFHMTHFQSREYQVL